MALDPFRHTGPRRIVLAAFLLVQGYGVVALHPFGLSFYDVLVGGLPGAERLGLELTYWSDPVDRGAPGSACAGRPARGLGRFGTHALPGAGDLTTNLALAHRQIVLADEQEGFVPSGSSYRAEPRTGRRR